MDIQQIIRIFEKKVRDSTTLKGIARGASQYTDAQAYAEKTAEELVKSIERFVSIESLTQEDAVALFGPALESNYKVVAAICRQVQERINEAAKIGAGVLEPEFDMARAQQVGIAITDAENKTPDLVRNLVTENSLNVVGDSIRKNSEAQENMGLKVHVVRKYSGKGLRAGTKYAEPCQWCLKRCGSWDNYKDAQAAGCFERHPGCLCTIDYDVEKTHYTVRGRGAWWERNEHGMWKQSRSESKSKKKE